MITTGHKEYQSDYYDQYYINSEEYKKDWKESVYVNLWLAIVSLLPVDKETKILDAGCGSGQFASMLYDLGYKNVTGVDFSKEAINIAKTKSPFTFIVSDLFTVDVKDFDLIICGETLEHLKDDLGLLKRWKGKEVILTVPSFDSPSHVRYFQNKEDVLRRYSFLFTQYECNQVNKWFILKGR